MHDAVSYRVDRRAGWMRLEKVQQEADRRAVIGGGQAPRGLRFSPWIVDDEGCAPQTDAIDLRVEPAQERCAGLIDREADARRAAVDRQNAGQGAVQLIVDATVRYPPRPVAGRCLLTAEDLRG